MSTPLARSSLSTSTWSVAAATWTAESPSYNRQRSCVNSLVHDTFSPVFHDSALPQRALKSWNATRTRRTSKNYILNKGVTRNLLLVRKRESGSGSPSSASPVAEPPPRSPPPSGWDLGAKLQKSEIHANNYSNNMFNFKLLQIITNSVPLKSSIILWKNVQLRQREYCKLMYVPSGL